MKKIFSYTMMLLAGMLVFTSCENDRDSNPTLTQPTSFVLNNPTVGAGLVDLYASKGVNLTWSQPTPYDSKNSAVVVTYTIQVSPTGQFTKEYVDTVEDNTGCDYASIAATTTACDYDVPAASIDRALEQVTQWEDETVVPQTQETSIRIKAAVMDAASKEYYPIYSNVVKINTIPYYIELNNADPLIWYLIGADIADGTWGTEIGKSVLPMQTIDGFDYNKKNGQGMIQWIGYLEGNGFKLRGALDDEWATQWGQDGTAGFGTFVKNDGGSSDIKVPASGYYTVTLDTKNDVLTVEEYTESVDDYGQINVSGSFNDWGDEPMTPCMGANNHDWYTTLTLSGSDEIKFKDDTSSWTYNSGGSLVTLSNGDMYGYGVQNGDNIKPGAGTWLIIYNDITRYYRFIKQ